MTSAYTNLEGGDRPTLRSRLISVPYSPSTAMAKMNCRKRRNKFAAKIGKGREVWMDIFFFFYIPNTFVFVWYTKGGRGGARGERTSKGFCCWRILRGLEDGDVGF